LRGWSVIVRVPVCPPAPYAVSRKVCDDEQLNGKLSLPFGPG
jgi:hypothetical protein